MSPLMAYHGNETERFVCWLNKLDNETAMEFTPKEMDGWGVGYFTGDRALTIKRPHTDKPWKFSEEMSGIKSKTALWRIIPKPEGIATSLDIQPLHYGHWLFICEGLPTFSNEVREDIGSNLADHFQKRIKGRESEYLFYWILQQMQKEGYINNPPTHIKTLVESLQSSINTFAQTWMPNKNISELAAVLSNGRLMLVFSHNGNMHISFKEGLNDCTFCTNDPADDYYLKESHNRSRAIFIIRGITPTESDSWQKVSDETIIAIDRDLSTHHFRWPL